MNVGNLAASLSMNLQPFQAAIKQSLDSVRRLGDAMNRSLGPGGASGIDATSRSVKKLSSEFKDLDRIVSGILISQMFYGAVNAIQDGISSVMHFNNEMAKAAIGMEYFLGSAERAQGFILNMKDFAADTAFSTEQALALSRKLMGAQFEAKEIRSVMEILNDANAATGATAEHMDRIVLAMTQMKTNGRIMGSELRQLAEAGIPVYQILREELGLTAEQMANIGDLKISGDLGVNALLSGLQRRYQGAADRIAETVPGMWETIKDNTLFIMQEVTEGVYGKLEGFLRKWRDTIETAREIMTSNGLGGVFEHFVPPELQDKIRLIIGAFQQFGQAIKQLYAAIRPLIETVGVGLVHVLSAVLPPIAGVVRGIASLIAYVIQANPWVKALGAAIVGLMVAQVAAKALMFLWSVTRIGVIAAAVAKAVGLLSGAIQFLTITMMRNPLIAVVMVTAGALMALAFSSKTASAWLDNLMAKLGGFTGIDVDEILQPSDDTGMDKWMEEFNDSVSGINDGLKETGKEITDTGKDADKAGKKVEDKFVAAFDELYQIPDKLDDVKDSMGGVGDAAGLDDIKLPSMPEIPKLPTAPKLPPVDTSSWNDLTLPPILENLKNQFRNFEWPNLPPPNFAVVTDALGTINSALANLRLRWADFGSAIPGVLSAMGQVIQDFITNPLGSLNAYVTGMFGSLAAGLANGLVTVTEWVTNVGGMLVDMVGMTGAAIAQWVVDIIGGIGSFATGTVTVIATWAQGIADTFNNMVTITGTIIATWAAGQLAAVTQWATNARTVLTGWVTGIGDAFTQWATTTRTAFTNWANETRTTFTNWVNNTRTAITTWATNVQATFTSWANNTRTTITTWITNTQTAFNTWVTTVRTSITTWANNTQATFTSWATNVRTTITTWSTNTLATISTWISTTRTNITAWSTGIATVFTTWANTIRGNIQTWARNTNADFNKWITSVGTNLNNWGRNVVTNMNLALSATGTTINNWISGTSRGFEKWINGMLQGLGTFATSGAKAIGAFASASWGTLNSFLRGTSSGIGRWANSIADSIWNSLKSAWGWLRDLASAAGETIGSFGEKAGAAWSGAAADMGAWVGEHKTEIILTAGAVALAGTAIALAPYTGGWSLGLLGLETGGIVDRHQIVEIGEGNKREAVIPLENSTYMAPFSAAVANDLVRMLGNQGVGGSQSGQGSDTRPILYVGTLIADDRSLKELYRKMEVIGIQEDQRKGRG